MRSRRAGLTLMEVLVAVSLLSLLSAGILMALRVGTGAWEKGHSELMLDRRIATTNTILHAELESICPAWGVFLDPVNRAPYPFLFFEGEPDAMRFVSSYSLESGPRGGLRLVELRIVPGERGQRVLLNDQPYGGPRAAGSLVTGLRPDAGTGRARLLFAPIEARPSSFIIADRLDGCSFSYLVEGVLNEPQRWVTQWEDPSRLPAAVSIQMTSPQDRARLRPVTVTVPVRATMTP